VLAAQDAPADPAICQLRAVRPACQSSYPTITLRLQLEIAAVCDGVRRLGAAARASDRAQSALALSGGAGYMLSGGKVVLSASTGPGDLFQLIHGTRSRI